MVAVASVAAAAFVVIVLSDPTSRTRELLERPPPGVARVLAVAEATILMRPAEISPAVEPVPPGMI
jgi:hypothetical protein